MRSIFIAMHIGSRMCCFHQIPIANQLGGEFIFILGCTWKDYLNRIKAQIVICRSARRRKSAHYKESSEVPQTNNPHLLGFRIPPRMVVLGPATKVQSYFSQFTIPDEFWRLIHLLCRSLLVYFFHESTPPLISHLYTPACPSSATND